MIPKYVVFNINMTDGQGNALPVGQGDNLDELLSVYHGKAYEILEPTALSENGRLEK